MTDLELLRLKAASLFVLDKEGRIVRENDPDASPGPKAYVAGCADGNIALFHRDVDAGRVEEIQAVLAKEPPLSGFTAKPVHVNRYVRILTEDCREPRISFGLNWHLPNNIRFACDGRIVSSGTPDGEAFLIEVRRDGAPPALHALGFKTVADFWAPWCLVFKGAEIAAHAFAARLGPSGAHLGLVTVPAFRGRGFGAAATAAWSALPDLAGRALFYGTDVENRSSQRVTERLGLRYMGASLRIG